MKVIAQHRGKSRERATGANSPTWKGGITPLQNYLRNHNTAWKKESVKVYGEKCLMTGMDKVVIHHLFSFSVLLAEVLKELRLAACRVCDTDSNDLCRLKELLLKKHMECPGVPLCDEVHGDFHRKYGKGKNTPDQFKEYALKAFGKHITLKGMS